MEYEESSSWNFQEEKNWENLTVLYNFLSLLFIIEFHVYTNHHHHHHVSNITVQNDLIFLLLARLSGWLTVGQDVFLWRGECSQ